MLFIWITKQSEFGKLCNKLIWKENISPTVSFVLRVTIQINWGLLALLWRNHINHMHTSYCTLYTINFLKWFASVLNKRKVLMKRQLNLDKNIHFRSRKLNYQIIHKKNKNKLSRWKKVSIESKIALKNQINWLLYGSFLFFLTYPGYRFMPEKSLQRIFFIKVLLCRHHAYLT